MAKRATPQSQGQFPETVEKAVLRDRDLTLLRALAEEKGRLLRYCGLAGENAYDVMAWKDVLDTVTIVERPFKKDTDQAAFEGKVIIKLSPVFNGNLDLQFADVWAYLSSAEFAASLRSPDVINLDFCGGLINYTDLDYPMQRAAFQGMFARALRDKCNFVLLITLMPRDRGKTTYKEFLAEHVEAMGKSLPGHDDQLLLKQLAASQAFHEKSNLTLFKACVPILLEDIGRGYNFRVRTEYVRLYTTMIHFAFRCSYITGKLGIPADNFSSLRTLNDAVCKLDPNGTMKFIRPPQVVVSPRGLS